MTIPEYITRAQLITAPPGLDLDDMVRLIDECTPPRKILMCGPGRADTIRAAMADTIAKETDPWLRLALERTEIRETAMLDDDKAYLITHPEDMLKQTLGKLAGLAQRMDAQMPHAAAVADAEPRSDAGGSAMEGRG